MICIVKMGFGIENRVRITDFDLCEIHNLGTQWFRLSHVELKQPKVEALAEMCQWICGRQIAIVHERFTGAEDRPIGPVVIVAVDSLEERRNIWDKIKERDDVRFLIDARMGAEVTEIFAVDLEQDDTSAYERSLDPGNEPYEEECTRQAILYTVLGAASFVGSMLRAYSREESFPRHLVFDFRNFMIDLD